MRIVVALLVILALLLWAGVVWFAFPLIGFGEARPFDALWVRLTMIGVVWFIVGLVYLIKFLRRRKAAKALEEAVTEPLGDGEVLDEKMSDALAVLKKSSGNKNYLYELPWYVIIGPPGAGKTTALLNSGVRFPLADKGDAAVKGVGGTRYCEWMFSEEAVLIDTAGRYTTQDSDQAADKESWKSFLTLLKQQRSSQPINGVMLAISLSDVMTWTELELEANSEIVRKRLMEIHETLKVDFPVYVMFTKADLISGFMEYFGAFSASRRQKVWGHSFQNEARRAQTVDGFGLEYDALVERLSEEVTDRLQEEPDGINRIAIFNFPGQVAMLKPRLEAFMKGVFGHTRYKVNATLRGFYFTSGTQEGTPIDQVLGLMERQMGTTSGQGMSGKGKSFFLHDLLRKVIFAEAGWVSTDRKAIRRQRAMRYGGFAVIGLATLGMLGLWGWSFYQNRELIRTAEAAIDDYELVAQDELSRTELRSNDVLEILPYLDLLRDMPLGYADVKAEDDGSITERFGLGQRERLEVSAEATYAQALERMFRSRLILRVEEQLQADLTNASENILAVYETLKTYKLLGGVAPAPDDDFVTGWFREDWRNVMYPGPQNAQNRDALELHLAAMLELDGRTEPSFELNGPLIDNAERALARMNVADQAYSLVLSTVEFADIESFSVANRGGRDSDLVFETKDGSALDTQVIPALFTYDGFHNFFIPQLQEIAAALLAEQWVMGPYADEASLNEQVERVPPILLARYTEDWIEAWDKVIDNLKLRPMTADAPGFLSLAAASGPRTSPILLLANEIATETRLTEDRSLAAAAGVDGAVPDDTANLANREVVRRLSGNQLTLKRFADSLSGGKSDGRVGGANRLPGAEIENYFTDWQTFVEGEPGQRQADLLLSTLSDIQSMLILGVDFPDRIAGQLPPKVGALKQVASRLPEPLEDMINDVVADLEQTGDSALKEDINRKLRQSVTPVCEGIVANRFPFFGGSSRDASMADFGRLLGPNGIMDRFFLETLSPHVDISSSGWRWREGPLEDSSLTALRQFERAAKIRDVFFPAGSPVPSVQMTVSPVSIHATIENAILDINGTVVTAKKRGNVAQNVTWPGSTGAGSVSLQFVPQSRGRESRIGFQGPWAFMRFLSAGQLRVVQPNMQTRHVIGGRDLGLRFDLAASENPFTLRELGEFRCPTGL